MKIVEATEIVMDLASQQWGLVTTAQATAEGVPSVMLGRLVDRAVLARIRSGVYAVESTPGSSLIETQAQWLALEPRLLAQDRLNDPTTPAVISHESAASLHEMGDLNSYEVHFTVPSRRQTRQPEVIFHIADLSPQDWVVIDGLPVTTPLRTVIDLARAGHEPGHLLDMVSTIVNRELATRDEIIDALSDVSGYFAIASDNRAGVRAWLDEQFPLSGTPTEEILTQQLEVALAPIKEQIQQLMERLPATNSMSTMQRELADIFAGMMEKADPLVLPFDRNDDKGTHKDDR